VLGNLFEEIKKLGDHAEFCNRAFELGPEPQKQKAFKEFQKDCFYTSLLFPFHQYEYKPKKGGKVQGIKIINKVTSDSLKKSNEVLKFVTETVPFIDQAISYADLILPLS
jgi:hypothetical protein